MTELWVDGDQVLLTAYLDGDRPGHVVRQSPDGTIRWTRQPVEPDDYFIALSLDQNQLVATSWRGQQYRLSLDGEILTTEFVK